jgi:hypothetical protein
LKRAITGSIVFGMLVVAVFPTLSAKRVKDETIEATAMGTGNQLGQSIGISVEIYEYSTPEDRQVLIDAFSKGQNQLPRGSAVGSIAMFEVAAPEWCSPSCQFWESSL